MQTKPSNATVLLLAVVLMIVSRLNLGLTVAGFGSAVIAAIVIAVIGAVVNWLLAALGISFGGGLLGTIVYLVVAAVVLMVSDRFVAGMKVNGFSGAIIAAIAIAVVYWLVTWLLGLVGITIYKKTWPFGLPVGKLSDNDMY